MPGPVVTGKDFLNLGEDFGIDEELTISAPALSRPFRPADVKPILEGEMNVPWLIVFP
jgi:hypothetical protein